VELILRDHRPLKSLVATMQNYGLGFDERHEAFERFLPLYTRHARAEEQVLYAFLKSDDRLREDGLQGDVEHALADQLLESLEGTTDLELYSARLKVLAELVGHHLQAEERALLPHVKQHLEPGEREAMGLRYLELRESLSPDEARLGAPGAEGPNAVAARAGLFDSGPQRELATEVDQDEPPDKQPAPGSTQAGFH
jgi:hemerythrin superfamily protein